MITSFSNFFFLPLLPSFFFFLLPFSTFFFIFISISVFFLLYFLNYSWFAFFSLLCPSLFSSIFSFLPSFFFLTKYIGFFSLSSTSRMSSSLFYNCRIFWFIVCCILSLVCLHPVCLSNWSSVKKSNFIVLSNFCTASDSITSFLWFYNFLLWHIHQQFMKLTSMHYLFVLPCSSSLFSLFFLLFRYFSFFVMSSPFFSQ